MKIPHRLIVDREEYRVVYGSTEKAGGKSGDGGICDTKKRLITLCPDLRTDRPDLERVFWHEVLHGLDEVRRIGLTHGQIDRLGKALAIFAADNGLEFKRATRAE